MHDQQQRITTTVTAINIGITTHITNATNNTDNANNSVSDSEFWLRWSFFNFPCHWFSSSCVLWYEHLTAAMEPWKILTTRYNSYFIFLRLLGHFLAFILLISFFFPFDFNAIITEILWIGNQMESMTLKNQSSLKARLYVKMQGKKIWELSPVGLYHVMSACLVVALSTQSSDMVRKAITWIICNTVEWLLESNLDC